MTLPVETKRPSLDLVISVFTTKIPDRVEFSRRNQQHFRTRVYGVLDIFSRAVLTDRKQVAAVAASVVPGSANIHTTLYVSLNPGKGLPTKNQMIVRIRDILKDLEKLTDPELSNVSESPMMKPHSTEFMATFYNYGWKRFQSYYNKRIERLPEARRLFKEFKVEHATSRFFGPEHVEHLDLTLWWLGTLGKVMQLSRKELRSRLAVAVIGEQYERFEGLIDQGDMPPTKLFMAYDTFEKHLKSRGNFIPIIRWVTKLCSLHIDARRLVALAMSIRFRGVLFGDLDIEIYNQEAPSKKKIKCNDKILLNTVAHLRQKFEPSDGQGRDEQETLADGDIVKILKHALEKDWAKYFNPSPCVHCEVFLLRSIQIAGVSILPYIGVSKLSCVPCSAYFELLGAAGFDPVSTKGSHGKVYPGWSFPSDGKNVEDAERFSNLEIRVRDRLEFLLWRYIDDMRRSPRNSGSSVGSDDSPVQGLTDYRKDMSLDEQGILSGLLANEKWAVRSVVPEL